MTKKSIMTKQRVKYSVLIFISVLLIFSLIGVIAIGIISNRIFASADSELKTVSQDITEQGFIFKNPRIIRIFYDDNFNLIYADVKGDINLPTVQKSLNSISTVSSDGFAFRSLTVESGGVLVELGSLKQYPYSFVQVLINIDGELALLKNIAGIYYICLAVALILVAGISIMLSYLTMRPVEKLLKDQTQFVADASHELRSPLTVIQSRLENILTQPSDTVLSQSENIAKSLEEVYRLKKLTGDLLMLAKGDMFKDELILSEFNLLEVMRDVCEPYEMFASEQNKTLTSSGGDFMICGDKDKIKQLLIILLDNAVKYTKENDCIAIKARLISKKAVITVSDTGPGVAPDKIQYLFERFFREEKDRDRTGSGLGLSIAKWIVSKHNGKISAAQNSPQGLTINVILPQ